MARRTLGRPDASLTIFDTASSFLPVPVFTVLSVLPTAAAPRLFAACGWLAGFLVAYLCVRFFEWEDTQPHRVLKAIFLVTSCATLLLVDQRGVASWISGAAATLTYAWILTDWTRGREAALREFWEQENT